MTGRGGVTLGVADQGLARAFLGMFDDHAWHSGRGHIPAAGRIELGGFEPGDRRRCFGRSLRRDAERRRGRSFDSEGFVK